MYDFQTSRDCIVYIYDNDGYIHASWSAGDGKILSFEIIPENYPPGSYKLWDNEKEYVEAIREVDWIMSPLVEDLNDDKGTINYDLKEFIKAIEDYRDKEV